MPVPAKRFKLTQAVIDSWYTQSGFYKFRCGYDTNDGKTFVGPEVCTLITIADTDVVQTTNNTAQNWLEQSRIPQGVFHNGQRPPAGSIWIDVTDTIPVANVDLDPYFPQN